MPKFYFTYGTDPSYPYQGGWTEIEAPDLGKAGETFSAIHPDRHAGILNCAFTYTEERFKTSEMYKSGGNCGCHCHERLVFDGYRNRRIAFHREALATEIEFVIRCAGKEMEMSVEVEGYISPLKFAIPINDLIQIGQNDFSARGGRGKAAIPPASGRTAIWNCT